MPNAQEIKTPHSWLVFALGYTGSGKTTNALTFPGKKFAYLFDPNAIRTMRGHDVDYEEFLPDIQGFAVKSLKKKEGKAIGDKAKSQLGSEVYRHWEEHYEDGLEHGFFDQYDTIIFDSCTTFLDIIMDRVLTINGRPGQWPNQDDYGPQMVTFTNIVRSACSLGKNLYFTGHVEIMKDEISNRVFQTPILTGKLKAKIPLLFSEILFFEAQADTKGQVEYTVQTKPDRLMPLIRTTLRGLDYKEGVTIDFSKPLQEQGLHKLIQKSLRHIEGGSHAKVRSA